MIELMPRRESIFFKKNVIILGGGFAGIKAALAILKCKEELDIRITLIDRNSYHLFSPALYEVVTREEPQKNITIPLKEILGDKVHLVKEEVLLIDTKHKMVRTKNKSCFYYDFLIISLGSQPAFFGIQGLSKYSYPLKTLDDALAIQTAIKKAYHKKAKLGFIDVFVGGGGFSGTELVAELLTFRESLAKQLFCKNDCMRLTIIQRSDRLLRELRKKASEVARKRLEDYGVRLCFGERVKSLTKDCITTDMENCYKCDIFIWTGGVRASSVIGENGFSTNYRGQLIVNEYLQVVGYKSIFAAGDNAEFIDLKTKQHAPWLAQVAEEQGKVVAENIYRLIKRVPLKKYKLSKFGYAVPLKGRFAIFEFKNVHVVGFLGWIIQQAVLLRYLLGILPLFKALKRWNKFERELKQS